MGVMDRYNEKKKKDQEKTGGNSASGGVAERYERNQYYQTLDTDSVNDKYINTFVSDTNNFFGGVNKGSVSYSDAVSTIGDLGTRLDTIEGWLYKNRNSLGEKTYNALSSNFNEIKGSIGGIKEFYSQFDSEDAYNYWQRSEGYKKKYSAQSQEDILAALGLLEDGEEKDWLRNYQYERVKQLDDFSQYSQYANEEKGLGKYLSDPTYEYINGKMAFAFYDTLAGAGAEYNLDQMDEDEISVYNYLYAKEGKEKAEEYLAQLNDRLVSREKQEISDQFSSFANELPVLSSVASVPLSLLSGYESAENAIKYFAEKAVTGEAQLDPSYTALASSTIRGTVTEQVDWEIGNWDAFDFLYNTTMSGADSMTASLVFGDFGGVVLGLSAAAQATNDALDRGMSDGQAFWNGLFAGVFESLFETVSIGNFNKLKEVAPDSVKTIIKNLGKSMLVNASEETLTELANIAYDTMINGDFANYTWEELKNGAWKDALAQVIEAGASGALMGLGMGGAGNAIGYAKGSNYAKQVYGSNPSALVDEALEIDPGNAFAQKMQGRLNSGKSLSGGQLNRLVQQNETTMIAQDRASIQAATAQRLRDVGATENVDAIAEALTKQAMGEKLTLKERLLVKDYAFVAEEMKPENIREGKFKADWVQKIDTNRINAQEYGRMLQEAQEQQKTAETDVEQVPAEAQKEPQAVQAETVEPVEASETPVTTGKESLQVAEESPDTPEAVEESTVTLEDVSQKYGQQAKAMVQTYQAGQDVAKFDAAYQMAYDMGRSGVALSYVHKSEAASYLTKSQKELAYEAGKAAANASAAAKDAQNKAAGNGRKGRKKGVVRGDGVTVKDLDEAFNMTQGLAYKVLVDAAEATGIDIVLYRSEANAEGEFVDENGKEIAQGKYDGEKDPGTLYIDLNAGLRDIKDAKKLHRYFMLRTFTHEFTHFIEKWNPIQYNEFRALVFATMTERGENVHDLIELKQKQNPGMGYEAASREVVAESLVDILPETNFVQELAQKHKGILNKLLERLKEFVENLKAYYQSIGGSYDRGAIALKEQVGDTVQYLDSIVKKLDQIAVQAVENFQQTVATEEVAVTENETTTTADKTEAVAETTEATTEETTTSEHGFTITDNAQYGSLEITFDGKPPVQVLDALKAAKFRWNRKKGVWYGKADRNAITEALNKAFEAETVEPADSAPEQSEFEKAFWNATQEERDEVVDAINQNTKITHIAPTEIRERVDAETNEEVTDNGENADTQGAVLEAEPDGRGAARLLDEVEAGDVQGDGGSGDAAGSPAERGPEAGRNGDR